MSTILCRHSPSAPVAPGAGRRSVQPTPTATERPVRCGRLRLSDVKPEKGPQGEWAHRSLSLVLAEILWHWGKAGLPDRDADEWCPEPLQRELVQGINLLLFSAQQRCLDYRTDITKDTGLSASGPAGIEHARYLAEWMQEEHPRAEGPHSWNLFGLEDGERDYGDRTAALAGPRRCATEADEVRAIVELFACWVMAVPGLLGPPLRILPGRNAEQLRVEYQRMEDDVLRLVLPAWVDGFIQGV
ncbi:MAG: hypothetical protein ACK47B_21680 [Armatimonadota bacterium]